MAAADARAPVILALGDSLTSAYGVEPGRAWTVRLQDRLVAAGHPHRVVNAGITGDTSAGGLARLPALLEREAPAVVILELGGNDGLRGLSLTATRDNLAAMIRLARQAGAKVLLVGMRLPPNYGREYTEAFAALYAGLAEAYQPGWLPFLLEGVATDPALMQDDGIHPNARAQSRIVDNLWPVLQPLLGH